LTKIPANILAWTPVTISSSFSLALTCCHATMLTYILTKIL
jgi:hypothetical protein